jgi:crotonobetainyl-CoA:carnitine CoA-transferase CaiB-like acyl-CoA transferase
MPERLRLLQGVRVIAFTQFLLGPAAAQYLADMGADVIKIEEPTRGPYERHWSGGDSYRNGVSTFFLLAHRNVRSLGLDLKHADAREIVLDLCRDADVVLVNFRPGVMERLGFGYDELKRVNPDLIYACGTGYGADSPYRDLPGQDLLLQAMTGLASVTGSADGPPVAAGAAIVDQHAASLLAMGVLAALHRRSVTGEGERVEATMVQAALDLQSEPLLYHLNDGVVERPRVPIASSFHEGPYGFYPVRDGHVALSLSPLRLISKALGEPPVLEPFLDPTVAFSEREEIWAALSPLLSGFTLSDLLELFRGHGIWCAPVNDYDAMLADPVVTHLDPIEQIDHPEAGRVNLLRHPIRFGSGTAAAQRMPPAHGQHTTEVLRELGYDPERISALHTTGAVGPHERQGDQVAHPPSTHGDRQSAARKQEATS